MKKRITLIVAAILLICPILFSSCDTLIFGSSPQYVLFMEAEAENERYMIWGDLLVDNILLHALELLTARGAPRSPEVDKHDLALQG